MCNFACFSPIGAQSDPSKRPARPSGARKRWKLNGTRSRSYSTSSFRRLDRVAGSVEQRPKGEKKPLRPLVTRHAKDHCCSSERRSREEKLEKRPEASFKQGGHRPFSLSSFSAIPLKGGGGGEVHYRVHWCGLYRIKKGHFCTRWPLALTLSPGLSPSPSLWLVA